MKHLLGARSYCNESNGKDMHSCLSQDGVVQCYFPTVDSAKRNAALFMAAPDLLEALKELNFRALIAAGLEIGSGKRLLGKLGDAMVAAGAAIAKAEGGAEQ
jgi:hypothetical protein